MANLCLGSNWKKDVLNILLRRIFDKYEGYYIIAEIVQTKEGVKETPKYILFNSENACQNILFLTGKYNYKNGVQFNDDDGYFKFIINGQCTDTVEVTFKVAQNVGDNRNINDFCQIEDISNNEEELEKLYKKSVHFVIC